MSTTSVDYTGENVPTQGLVTTPIQAATQIMCGYIPANLVDMSTNSHFRDAVLGYVLRDTTVHDAVLNTLCAALRSAAEKVQVRTFSEYVAAVSFAFERKDITVKAISRNEPAEATSFLWSVAQAMNKQMPGPFYQTLIIGQMNQAEAAFTQTAGI